MNETSVLAGEYDTYARDGLPPGDQWPVLLLDRPEYQYPERLNCVVELLDRRVAAGEGDRACFRAPGTAWTYADLQDKVDRIARVLTRRYGLRPGACVMLRAPNTPMMVATYLAVIKAGAIIVATMPLLRAKELGYMLRKARIRLAVCDHRLLDELLDVADGVDVVPMGG